MTKIGALVVTFNRPEKLVNTLQSLQTQTTAIESILVIDNHSSDNIAKENKINCDSFSNVEYKYLSANLGGAGGFAEGLKVLQTLSLDYVLVSDDDVVYSSDYVRLLLAQVEETTGTVVLTGTVKNKTDGSIELLHRRRLVSEKPFIKQESVHRDDYAKDFQYDVFSFIGVMIPMAVINTIGVPRADFFIWFDDTEYSLRIKRHYTIRNVSAAVIYHDDSLNSTHSGTWKNYYGFRNELTVEYETQRRHSLVFTLAYFFKNFLAILRSHYQNKLYVSGCLYNGTVDAYLNRLGLSPKYKP
ncbi:MULTISPECIES: glycosyltransferase [unclassified Lacticaseibacillus]|uniref:glycosyltransferase n=1 Tax=unclassified Lacticaseibacillus TaxID=2759744 RepID=UPI0019432C16|nr:MULTISPECIES: glycosyltransferase [unclassified Lacticaseibacillus]